MEIKNIFDNEQAVSPIVATLVLVVVAIAGAAAVGTIMGSFSSDVSDEASVGDASDSSSTELLIAGSSTVQPVSDLLAEAYMDKNSGIKVTVQGGGSGAGIAGARMGHVDIGAASKDVSTSDYPELEVFTIGGSGVVVIGNFDNDNLNDAIVTSENLTKIYEDAGDDDGGKVTLANVSGYLNVNTTGDEITVYQRHDKSGTEETFAKFLEGDFPSDKNLDSAEGVTGKEGNQGVLAAVEETPGENAGYLGFVDFGFADGSDKVEILNLEHGGEEYDLKADGSDIILDSLSGDADYPLKRPLNYMTNGNPSTVEQSFINFAMSPGSKDIFHETGYYAAVEFY